MGDDEEQPPPVLVLYATIQDNGVVFTATIRGNGKVYTPCTTRGSGGIPGAGRGAASRLPVPLVPPPATASSATPATEPPITAPSGTEEEDEDDDEETRGTIVGLCVEAGPVVGDDVVGDDVGAGVAQPHEVSTASTTANSGDSESASLQSHWVTSVG